MQFTTELVAHAICQLGRPKHQAGQRFPWQQERHWKEYFKKIVITVSLLLLSQPQPSHFPYKVINTSWWVATPCQDLHDGCWLTVNSSAFWQVWFFILQGVKPPSSTAKNWWGSPLSHPLPDHAAGCTGFHVVAEQLWSDLTWLLYQLLLSKHKLSSLFSTHFLKEQVERITLPHCKRPKHFPFVDHFVNSLYLFLWLCIRIVRRILMLITLTTWRPKPNHVELQLTIKY